MRRTSLAAFVAAVSLALAGCGGGEPKSDKQLIEETLRAYYTAFSDSDGEKACAQLTKEAQRQITTGLRAKDCATGIVQATKRPDVAPYAKRFRDAKVEAVKVEGNSASATVKAFGQTRPVPLRKEDGDWLIEGTTGGPAG